MRKEIRDSLMIVISAFFGVANSFLYVKLGSTPIYTVGYLLSTLIAYCSILAFMMLLTEGDTQVLVAIRKSHIKIIISLASILVIIGFIYFVMDETSSLSVLAIYYFPIIIMPLFGCVFSKSTDS